MSEGMKDALEFILVLVIGLAIGALAVKATESDDEMQLPFAPAEVSQNRVVYYTISEADQDEKLTRIEPGFKVIDPKTYYGACDPIMGDAEACPSGALNKTEFMQGKQ